MRHCNAMVGYVFPFRTNPEAVNHKQICITDRYESVRAPTGPRWASSRTCACRRARWCGRSVRPAFAGRRRLSAEQHPDLALRRRGRAPRGKSGDAVPDRLDAAGLPVAEVIHDYTDADRRRRDTLVALARRVLRRAGGLVGKVRLIDSFSHAVGTARFSRSRWKGCSTRIAASGPCPICTSSTAASCQPPAA